MNDLKYERAVEPLRFGAAGVYADEAAVNLLIEHGTWLIRPDFDALYVTVCWPTDPDDVESPVVAAIDWRAAVRALDAGELPCSTSEAHVLRIAASIGAGVPVDLRGVLGNLDGRNLRLVLTAVTHANGHRGAEVSIR